MQWPRRLLVCPVVLEPQSALSADVIDIASFATMQKRRQGAGGSWILKKDPTKIQVLEGVLERGVYGVYIMVQKWRQYIHNGTDQLAEIQKIAKTISGGADQVKQARQLADAAFTEVLRKELCTLFYNPEITSLSLMGIPGKQFFDTVFMQAKKCITCMRASGLYQDHPHIQLISNLLSMAELTANMMFYYEASLVYTLKDLEVVELVKNALYFRRKLRSGYWFVDGWLFNGIGAHITRTTPRPYWSELACDLVKTSNAIGFNVLPATTEPICKF